MIYAFTGVPLFIFIAWFVVEQRVTWLVKSYVKHHVSQIVKLEDEIDTISEQVETIDQNIQEISEDVETISEDVEAISEDVNDIGQTPKIDIKEDIDVRIIKQ